MAKTGLAVAATAVGVVLVWSGIENEGIFATIDDVIHGNAPTAGASAVAIGSTTSTGSSGTGAVSAADVLNGNVTAQGGEPSEAQLEANQALGQQMAAAYGWGSGSEWVAFNNIVMAESGWNADAKNPDSTAVGIAQDINGWSSDYQEGNAPQEIAWMLQYIQQRYGNPINAWAFHLAHGWY